MTGDNTPVYWGLFAPALFLAGMAPAIISFAAGQAGFTVTLLVLYNLIVPTGWQAGLVRIQDVAIGVIWTADHLDIARQLQSVVAPPARALTAARARGWRPRG